jgi:hypothetical protein
MAKALKRVVVVVQNGLVEYVLMPDKDEYEVLVCDLDSFQSGVDEFPAASEPDVFNPLTDEPESDDEKRVWNMLRVYDGKDPRCQCCGQDYNAVDVVGGTFCSKTCEKRHWRM